MRKFFAVIFFVILVLPLMLSAQTAISVITWALDREFYLDTLDQAALYTVLGSDPLINQMLYSQLHLPPDADTTALTNLLGEVFSPEYIQSQASAYVSDLFDYLQGRTDEFTPVVDLRPLKTAIAGSQQDAFLAALMQALPECAPGQNPGFSGETETACKPAGVSDQLIIEQVLKPALPIVLAQIPDEAPIQGDLGSLSTNTGWRMFLPGMAAPASIMLSVLILSVIAAAVWYLIALIADSDWSGRLQWLGWMLMIPSLLIFLMGFAAQGGVSVYWINFWLERAQIAETPLGPEITEMAHALTIAALPRVTTAFRMVGGISGAFALALIFWGIATPKRKTA